jgi:hypothetical protein
LALRMYWTSSLGPIPKSIPPVADRRASASIAGPTSRDT